VELLAHILTELDAGRPVVLATVVACSGSTPRHPGARMALGQDERAWGTIGGGRIELEVTRSARQVLAGGPAVRVRHHLVRDLAMCCGGSMELVIAPVASSRDALAVALDAERTRKAYRWETPLDGAPLRITVDSDAGAARHELSPEAFVEVRQPVPRAVLFGAGHVGRAIGALARQVGFSVVVCDDGETGALEPTPPWADVTVDSFALADVEKHLGPLGAGDYVLVVTRDHAVDQRILEALAEAPCTALSYLGLIGSAGKIARFRKRLGSKGLLDEEGWARIHAPVGLDIGAETPEEIAVAVVAEMIAVRHRGHGRVAPRRPIGKEPDAS
jgi:xanthine dehydrogenase accessory factor